jgi:hypothetical protein
MFTELISGLLRLPAAVSIARYLLEYNESILKSGNRYIVLSICNIYFAYNKHCYTKTAHINLKT